jgi:hypothetical protein
VYLTIILKSFFRLNVNILAEFVFRLFNRVFYLFNRIVRLNFNLNFCLCILDDGNGFPLYFSRYFKDFNGIWILLRVFLFGFLT